MGPGFRRDDEVGASARYRPGPRCTSCRYL